MTDAEFATIAIAHNLKKLVSVMDAERNGRRLSLPTDVPSGGLKLGVIEAGAKEVGDFAIWQNLRLF